MNHFGVSTFTIIVSSIYYKSTKYTNLAKVAAITLILILPFGDQLEHLFKGVLLFPLHLLLP